jgi:hypothetical protein
MSIQPLMLFIQQVNMYLEVFLEARSISIHPKRTKLNMQMFVNRQT